MMVVQGFVALARARCQHGVEGFDVRDMGVKIPQAILA
jgi:hypothetical protein